MDSKWLPTAVTAVALLVAGAAAVAARTRPCLSKPCQRDRNGDPIQDGKCCTKPDCSFLQHMEDKMILNDLYRSPVLRRAAMEKAEKARQDKLGRMSQCKVNQLADQYLTEYIVDMANNWDWRSSRSCPGAKNAPGLEVVASGTSCRLIDSSTRQPVDPRTAHSKYDVCSEILDGILAHEQMHMSRCQTRDACGEWSAANEESDGYVSEFGNMYDQLQSWLGSCTGVANDADWADANGVASEAAAAMEVGL